MFRVPKDIALKMVIKSSYFLQKRPLPTSTNSILDWSKKKVEKR